MNVKIKSALLQATLLGSMVNYFILPSYGMLNEEVEGKAHGSKLRKAKTCRDDITSLSFLERRIKRKNQQTLLEPALRNVGQPLTGSCFGVPSPSSREIEVWIDAAEKSHFASLYTLGELFQKKEGQQHIVSVLRKKGRASEKDPLLKKSLAFYWWRRSQNQDDPEAWCEFGRLYGRGQGIEQDYVEAMKWYIKAAEQNYPEAQNNIGLLYECGQGVPKDIEEAKRWYRLAASGGSESGQKNFWRNLKNNNKKQ